MYERVNRPLAEAIRALLVLHRDKSGAYALAESIKPEALFNLVKAALGEEVSFYQEADRLIWDVARHEGYIIPASPVESRGDAKLFLREHGVTNANDWYKKRGFDEKTMRDFYGVSAVMARNTLFWRKVVDVPKCAADKAQTFAPYLVQAIDFCLGTTTQAEDVTLFKC